MCPLHSQNRASPPHVHGTDVTLSAAIPVGRFIASDAAPALLQPQWPELRLPDACAESVYTLLRFDSDATIATQVALVDLPANGVAVVDVRRVGPLFMTVDMPYRVLELPRRLLDRHVPARQWSHRMIPIDPGNPLGAVIAAYAGTLLSNGSTLSAAHSETVLDSLCRLLALAINDAESELQRPAVRQARLARVKRAIALRLAQPDLSPAKLAAVLGMSSRNLHLLFRESGETCSEYVMRCRMVACRTALIDPAQAKRAVTDVAFAVGFNNLTSFYRAFRNTFKMTPLEMRARAHMQSGAARAPFVTDPFLPPKDV